MSTSRTAAAPGVARELRHWLGAGACQTADGAFAAWRSQEDGALAFDYPEITGYALTHLAATTAPTPAEVAAAAAAAEWLVDRIGRGDLSARADWDGGAVYTFDLAMIGAGLLNHGRRFDDERADAAGREISRLLASSVSRGVLPALLSGPPPTARAAWSTEGVPHMLKAVQCLLLADETETVEVAEAMVAGVRAGQEDDGSFVTGPEGVVMLHPFLYTVEGLWIWGSARDDRDAIASARRAVAWMWQHQLPTGGFPRHAPCEADPIEQYDVTSQAVRIARLLDTRVPRFEDAVERLTQVVISDDTGRALPYQAAGPGRRHMNVWVTMFGAQALLVASEPGCDLPWHGLV